MVKVISPTNPFVEFPRSEVEQSIVARFEKEARRSAGRLAVQTDGYSLTYEHLNKLANGLARSIITNSGAGRKAVALLLAHDAPLIVAILGVIKAGRFYVVLEPSLPVERLRYIVQDCQCDLIVTDSRHKQQAKEIAQGGQTLVNYDELELQEAEENSGLEIAPSDLAYLIYTSGSTGKPKGVCQTHRNVLHHIRKYTNACHLCAEDRFSLLASCAFGASVSNLYGALLNGGTLLPFNLREQGIFRLADWLRETGTTIYHSVPTVFRNLAEVAGEERFSHLRLIKLGGEAITRRDFELYQRIWSDAALLYVGLGSTEMNCIRYWIMDKGSEFSGRIVPVGYPVEETDVLLLDKSGQEVAEGETGEIAIRSDYLFPGYWRQDERNRSAFIADPAGSNTPVFRTSDLGRILPNGLLQHLGRNEFQIKVRGIHVEVAEVEAALLEQREVSDCVVIGRERQDGVILVAYLTSASGLKLDSHSLRSRLAETLPDYMIPAECVWLDKLPRTNGKVDRQALAGLEIAPSATYLAPRSDLERELAKIWQDVLRKEQIGVRDDFFALGGHSLAAERIAASIEQLLGYKLPSSTLFWATTIETVARHLTSDKAAPARSLVELKAGGDGLPLFIVHGWGGDVRFHGELARLLSDQPVYGLQAVGLDGKAPRHIRLEDMAKHYLEEIRTVQSRGPYHLMGYSMGSLIAFEVAQQAYAAGEEVAFLGLLDPPTRPAPWLAYARTIAPLMAQSAREHLGGWVRSGGRESFHFRRRLKRLRRWIKRNKSKPPAIMTPPALSSSPPVIAGFGDYYSAVSSSYQLRNYPGAIDLVIGEVKSKALLPLWEHLAKNGARQHQLDCTHKQMISREFLPTLALTLRAAMVGRRSRPTASA